MPSLKSSSVCVCLHCVLVFTMAPSLCTEKLLSLIQESPRDVFMVFCNTVPSCDWTAGYLREHQVPVVKLHGGFAPQVSCFQCLHVYIQEMLMCVRCTDFWKILHTLLDLSSIVTILLCMCFGGLKSFESRKTAGNSSSCL